MTITARELALDVLDATLGRSPRPAEAVFDSHAALPRLSARDRAFARLLYVSCLRHLRALDSALSGPVQRQPKNLTLRNILRLGVAQLLLLDTPPHAAIKETVDLAKRRSPRGAGLVNAALRRLVGTVLPATDEIPAWLLDGWVRTYGAGTGRALGDAQLIEPPLDVTCPCERDQWASRLGGEPIGPASIRLGTAGAISALAGYDEGAWWVQDVAAASIVPLLGDLAGKRVLDIGAAPGGKTAQLCHAGAMVTAVEKAPGRAARLKVNMHRLGLEPEIVTGDVADLAEMAPFDAVLLDAPCTATGTIRRHPDIMRNREPAHVARMAEVQKRLLEAAYRRLAPGGLLLYAVCSLEAEEGPEQMEWVRKELSGLALEAIEPERLAGLPVRQDEPHQMRTLPCDLVAKGGMDGFFAALMRRMA